MTNKELPLTAKMRAAVVDRGWLYQAQASGLARRGLAVATRIENHPTRYEVTLTEAGEAVREEILAPLVDGARVRNTITGLVGHVVRVERSERYDVVVLIWDGSENETCGSAAYLEVLVDPVQEILREAQEDPQGAEDRAGRDAEAALFDAIQRHTPATTDLARYVAQLRRWAAEDLPEGDDWCRGRASAFAMVADQLERNVLGGLAPLLAAEAARRVAEDLGGEE